ncbi:MAG: GTP cyclohydrolase II [Octadecabacter sp.]|nr:GTP cyclohydrolase II [Octadecabacter sp.]
MTFSTDSFKPDLTERIARARADLRMGVAIVVCDGKTAGLVCAAEVLTSERLASLSGTHAVLAITNHRAATLKVTAYDGDLARVILPKGANIAWVRAMADPAGDLRNPMKGPFKTARDSSAKVHRAGIALTKAARLLPACIVVALDDGPAFAVKHDLTQLDADAALATDLSQLDPIISAKLPLDVSEAGRLHIFRPKDGGEEHYAVEIGAPSRAASVLTRLHSACFTGDLLGSLKCDCGPQLRNAMAQMGAEGAGVLVYLNQEGRGIGLTNKMRAYSLQDQGFDTVEANHRLGFADDERDFRIGAEILHKLGFSQVRLLTNNPAKVAKLESSGLKVTEQVPLKVGENRHNAAYLATKATKSGHIL